MPQTVVSRDCANSVTGEYAMRRNGAGRIAQGIAGCVLVVSLLAGCGATRFGPLPEQATHGEVTRDLAVRRLLRQWAKARRPASREQGNDEHAPRDTLRDPPSAIASHCVFPSHRISAVTTDHGLRHITGG